MQFVDEPDLSAAPTLLAARTFSLESLARARAGLRGDTAAYPHIVTIALAGSLGRLEAHAESDVDCIIVAQPEAEPDLLEREVSLALQHLDALGLKPAKTSGIFRHAIDTARLLEPGARGKLTEPAETFGKRMQMLLDARPVLHEAACVALQRAIIDWYGEPFIAIDPRRSWTHLINDLSRYLHAYAVWQQFKFEVDDADSWPLRQAKFRSTRLVTFAGLMLLLGASNARADKRAWLAERLHLTPLGRLWCVMRRYDAAAFARLRAAYETTQAVLAASASRRALICAGDGAAGSLSSSAGAQVLVVNEAEREIARVLTAFLLDRRADWDPRFFERLLF